MRRRFTLLLVLAGCAERPIDVPQELAPTDAAADLPTPDLGATDLGTADLAVDDLAGADLQRPPLRLIAPLSTSRVTSHRPTLRWQGGATPSVELCRDRACAQRLGAAPVDSSGHRARPNQPLAPGVVFWRVRDGAAVTPTWQFRVGVLDAQLDNSYGTTLDPNGDGFADVAVGELGYGQDPGAAHLYLGGPNGPALTPTVSIPGTDPRPGWWADWHAMSAGDLNGDGFGDFVVSSINVNFDVAMELGRVRVYLGSAAGLRVGAPITLSGPNTIEQFGRWVGGAGDVNGDGYGDLLVTSLGLCEPTSKCGPLYLYYGGPDGVSPARVLAVDTYSQNTGLEAATGDFNGDGYGDLLIGAPYESLQGTSDEGRAYVYYGGPDGLSAPTKLDAPTTVREFGWSVASADLDGDGYSDAVVAPATQGPVYIYAGGPNGLPMTATRTIPWAPLGFIQTPTAGDVNGDGRDDLLLGGQDGQGKVQVYLGGSGTLVPVSGSEDQYGFALAGAGDFDGDGYDDLVIGAPDISSGPRPGRAYLFRGGPAGVRLGDGGIAARLAVDGGTDSFFGYWVAGWH